MWECEEGGGVCVGGSVKKGMVCVWECEEGTVCVSV